MVAFLEAFRPRRVKRLTAYGLWNVCRECGWTPSLSRMFSPFMGPEPAYITGVCPACGGKVSREVGQIEFTEEHWLWFVSLSPEKRFIPRNRDEWDADFPERGVRPYTHHQKRWRRTTFRGAGRVRLSWHRQHGRRDRRFG